MAKSVGHARRSRWLRTDTSDLLQGNGTPSGYPKLDDSCVPFEGTVNAHVGSSGKRWDCDPELSAKGQDLYGARPVNGPSITADAKFLRRESAARRQSPSPPAEATPSFEAVRLDVRAELQSQEEACESAESSAHAVDRRFESVFAGSPIGMAIVGNLGRLLEVNAALCRITGYSQGQLKASTLEAITHPDDVDLDKRRKRDLLEGRIPSYEIEVRYRHARGRPLWVLVTVSIVRGDLGEPLYEIAQVQDISERKELAERLEYQVDHDFLTGLSNRRRFELELAREAQRDSRYGCGGALLLIDLDHFKEVNDALGHRAGDDLLRGVAVALRDRMRQTDVVARVGGDEFAVLLPQTFAEEARIVAAGIVDTLHQHVVVAGESLIRVTASVGLTLFDGLRASEILARADLAMYEAKAAGGSRFAMYGAADDPEQPHRRASRRGASARLPRETLCRLRN